MTPERDLAVADAQRVGDVRTVREAVDRRQPAEDAAVDTIGRLEMYRALRRVDVLRQLDLAYGVGAHRLQSRRQPVDDVAALRQQLTRLARVADLVRPFAEEPDEASAHVQPRSEERRVGKEVRSRGAAEQ